MLILAFDTATDVATCALVEQERQQKPDEKARPGRVLGERLSRAVRILEDVDALLAEAGVEPGELNGLAVGTGPGSYTGLRMGLVTARTLSFSLGVPVAGVTTLAALAHGAGGAVPVIDGRRGEVFTFDQKRPVCRRPEELRIEAGQRYVGDGALRYREAIESRGGEVPEGDDLHVPWARHHAALARDFGPAEDAQPLYLRLPDAERALERN